MIDYARLPRAQVEQAVLRMSFDSRGDELRPVAISAVNDYNDLAASKLTETAFNSAVQSMASKLNVAIPAVPADLASETDAQLATLANAMQLADWDYAKRTEALEQTRRYWQTTVASGVSPTPAQYVTTFLTLANYVRAARGLAAIS